MKTFIAFLRAVNVGGTGKLPMSELRALCEALGFTNVRTYIASGNLLVSTDLSKTAVRKTLEDRLEDYAGRKVGVVLRTPSELARLLEDCPFQDRKPNLTSVFLLDSKPPVDALDHIANRHDEEIHVAGREIHVHYPSGMGSSRLRIPAARDGTARNLNTLRKMLALATA